MKSIPSVRGVRDFYPEEMRVRSWLYQTIRGISEWFGYQEYDGPFLEPLDLYAAKSGEELVKEQAFVFPDRGGNLIALRPELTPSLARMVAQRQRQLAFPLRWWSFGPMWRYERPGKGRSREFFQWNADLVGVESPEADAELVAVAATFLRKVGLRPDEVQILVNNRRLVDGELEKLGIPQLQRPAVLRLIDRRDKMRPQEWAARAQKLGLQRTQFDGIVTMLGDVELWQQSDEFRRFFAAVQAFGITDYVRFAPHIVRGLDYYTGTVFEAWDQEGEFRAILGGGRYDNLVADVGGDRLPGVGFAMGDMVITLILAKRGRIPAVAEMASAPILVTVFDEQWMMPAIQLAQELRQCGLNVACYPQADRLRKQLKYADRIHSPVALIIGPDELAQDVVTVRDLRTSTQHTVARADVAAIIQRLLAE
jgi:histidyl-tRNA synthetase